MIVKFVQIKKNNLIYYVFKIHKRKIGKKFYNKQLWRIRITSVYGSVWHICWCVWHIKSVRDIKFWKILRNFFFQKIKNKIFASFFCSYVVSKLARFARGRIGDSSFNRFALNAIQRYFFGAIFVGGILSGYPSYHWSVPQI